MLHCGQILQGRYQLQEKLGDCATRQTWLALDLLTQPETLVIIKLLVFAEQLQWEEVKLFERQAQVLKQLDHPRIPKFRDYFSWQAHVYIFCLVQEYIPGISLKQLQERQRFTEQQIRKIANQILNILIYLHELNPAIIHRDLKLSNLIWGEDEQVYLIDFGAVQDQVAIAATFTIVGTYGYTPLEQFGGKPVPASDLYALGASLIHLLTGIAPADLPQRNLQFQFAELVNLSPNMISWLHQMTAPALENRFSSARIALQALESEIVLQPIINNSGQGGLFNASIPVPAEIKGWNWGAFLLAPVWLISNRVWIGLLAWIPGVGFWMAIALGVKGNEWAWKSRTWESIEVFKNHQKRWAIAGIISGITVNLIFWQLGMLLLVSLMI